MPDLVPLPDLSDLDIMSQLLSRFFTKQELRKEELLAYCQQQLSYLSNAFDQIILLANKPEFWTKIKDLAHLSKDEKLILAITTIVAIPKQLKILYRSSVQDKNSFDTFIITKAAEISSGDRSKDYFLAMKIRNDQLLASIYVYSEAYNHLTFCLELNAQDVLKHPSFIYFGEKNFDVRIYEVAQQFYQARLKLNLL